MTLRLWFAVAMTATIVIRSDRTDEQYLALGARFPAVAKIGRAGDGTLITPDWVLTAGHVAAGMDTSRARVYLGDVAYRIRRVVVHPEWRELGPHDIALIQLDRPVSGIATIPLYAGHDEVGMIATIVGHGDTRTGLGGAWKQDGLARGATSKVESVDGGDLVFRFHAPPAGTDLEGAPGRGDSGGPALIQVNGAWFIAGVSSAGYDGTYGPGTYGAVDHFTRVSDYVAWIEGEIQKGH